MAGAGLVATPAFGAGCDIGLPPRDKGPLVYLDYDQEELDAAYDQSVYEPLEERVYGRILSLSAETPLILGESERAAYGQGAVEQVEIWRAAAEPAPVFVFLHGGTWRFGWAADYAFPAELFVDAGAHYVAVDFADVRMVGGDLGVLADQVRRAIAWVWNNAAGFGGDRDRIYLGGHSSGGHLAAVALTTDWTAFGLPADALKGGLLMSGIYDLEPVQLSWRRSYIAFTDAMVADLSPIRHVARLAAPLVVTYGEHETPEFQRQPEAFAEAARAAGRSVEITKAYGYHHLEMAETLGNPYGANGRAALRLMGLSANGRPR